MPFQEAGAEGKEVTTTTGLQYVDLAIGTGATAEAGQTVTVHYTGWLENGTKFDSSVDRGQPFSFPLGAGRVIKGWDEGVKGMKVGGKRKLTIPAKLGYGAQGAGGVIPPHATLIFDVELLGLHGDQAVLPIPTLARPVVVDLDAVALGIVEVEGLRHEVVGRAREPVARRGECREGDPHPAEGYGRRDGASAGARVVVHRVIARSSPGADVDDAGSAAPVGQAV